MTTPIAPPKKTLTRRGFFRLAGTGLLMVTHPTIFLPKRAVITVPPTDPYWSLNYIEEVDHDIYIAASSIVDIAAAIRLPERYLAGTMIEASESDQAFRERILRSQFNLEDL